jgi:hypothetical protein
MEIILPIFAFIKNLGGPRSLLYIGFLLILGGLIIYIYLQGRGPVDSNETLQDGTESSANGGKFKDTLIAGLALTLVIVFLFMVSLLAYLMYTE